MVSNNHCISTNKILTKWLIIMDCTTITAKRSAPQPPKGMVEVTQPCKKPYFNRTLQVDMPQNNYLLAGYKECLSDIATLQTISTVNSAPPETLAKFQTDATRESLESLRDRAISTLNILFGPSDLLNNFRTILTPDSPVSLESSSSSPTTTELDPLSPQGFKITTESVVHGIGVVATRNFKENDEICLYDGPMVYRIFNHLSGKYYVFSINNKGNDSFDNIKFLEKDTYVAWSGINVESAGRPAIELGRNCEQDIRFLNHSKEANVMIRYTGMNMVKWGDQDSLRLTVVALEDIKSGEELFLDYDTGKPASKIDFCLSAVEEPTEIQKQKIAMRVNKLNQKYLQPESIVSTKRKKEKEIDLPEEINIVVDQIINTTENIRIQNGLPANLDELMTALTPSQKKLLTIIFSDEESNVEDLAVDLSPRTTRTTRTTQNAFMDKLTTENVRDLKTYFTRSIFNNKQTWITVQQLKDQLTLHL